MGDTLSEKEIGKICEKIKKLTNELENKKEYTKRDYEKFCGERTGILKKSVLEKLRIEKPKNCNQKNYLDRVKFICKKSATDEGLIKSTSKYQNLQNEIKNYRCKLDMLSLD